MCPPWRSCSQTDCHAPCASLCNSWLSAQAGSAQSRTLSIDVVWGPLWAMSASQCLCSHEARMQTRSPCAIAGSTVQRDSCHRRENSVGGQEHTWHSSRTRAPSNSSPPHHSTICASREPGPEQASQTFCCTAPHQNMIWQMEPRCHASPQGRSA